LVGVAETGGKNKKQKTKSKSKSKSKNKSKKQKQKQKAKAKAKATDFFMMPEGKALPFAAKSRRGQNKTKKRKGEETT
jgi:hypothetical protein